MYSNFLADEGAARLHRPTRAHLRAPRPGQAPGRPGEPVPRQPQHPARLTDRGGGRAPARSPPLAPPAAAAGGASARCARRGASGRALRGRTLGQGNVIGPPPALKPEPSCWTPADTGPPRARQPERPHDRLLRPRPGANPAAQATRPCPSSRPRHPRSAPMPLLSPPRSARRSRLRHRWMGPASPSRLRRSRASARARPASRVRRLGPLAVGRRDPGHRADHLLGWRGDGPERDPRPVRDRHRVAGPGDRDRGHGADPGGVGHDPRELRGRQEPRRPGACLRRDPGHDRGRRRRGPHELPHRRRGPRGRPVAVRHASSASASRSTPSRRTAARPSSARSSPTRRPRSPTSSAATGIISVDGWTTEGHTVEEVVSRVRGPEGEPVTLTIGRDGRPTSTSRSRAASSTCRWSRGRWSPAATMSR